MFLKWNNKQKYDACYEIIDPNKFTNAINKKFSSAITLTHTGVVYYTPSPIHHKSPYANVNPAITKEYDYAWQNEHRMLWHSKLPSPEIKLKYWDIEVPEAIQFCKIHSFIENGKIIRSGNDD